MNQSGLIIFVKKPILGQVKTRFQPQINPEISLEIYRSFVEDTLDNVTTLPEINYWLGCFPDCEDPWFHEIADRYPIRLFDQEGSNLGKRMEQAFQLLNHFQYKVIIGTDIPHLPKRVIMEAFDLLRSYPVVIGPSRDGGYYLLGISGKPPPIFDSISWGTEIVFNQTIHKLSEKQIPHQILPQWFDIDYFQDLLNLKSHLNSLRTNGEAVPNRTWHILESLEDVKWKNSHD